MKSLYRPLVISVSLHYRTFIGRIERFFRYFRSNDNNWFSGEGCWIHFWSIVFCFEKDFLRIYLFVCFLICSCFLNFFFCFNNARWNQSVFIIKRTNEFYVLKLLIIILEIIVFLIIYYSTIISFPMYRIVLL